MLVFAFIVGYTAGGFPYGITWEEMEEIERGDNELFEKEESFRQDEESDFPFD